MKATKAKKGKKGKKEKPESETFQIVCPECSCDHVIPLMRIQFTRSFAGNRMQVEWPTHKTEGDSATLSCPKCGIVFHVDHEGVARKTGKRWKGGGK
jgi:transcription elongation factor Elf1